MRCNDMRWLTTVLLTCAMPVLCACDNSASSHAADAGTSGKSAAPAPQRSDATSSAAEQTSKPAVSPASKPAVVAVANTKPFTFVDDEVGRWLEARLSPPRYTPADPVPFVDDAAAGAASPKQVSLAIDVRPFMPATAALAPKVIVPALIAAAPAPPARLPPLAPAGDALVHMQTTFAIGALTFVASPPVDRPLPLPLLALPTEKPVTVNDNPAAAAVRELSMPTVKATPGPAATGAPAIVDPFAGAREIRPTQPISDVDAPAASFDVPRAPTFEVQEAPAK